MRCYFKRALSIEQVFVPTPAFSFFESPFAQEAQRWRGQCSFLSSWW